MSAAGGGSGFTFTDDKNPFEVSDKCLRLCSHCGL